MEQVSEIALPPGTQGNTTRLLQRSALLSLVWVTFLWGFLDDGVYALGLNATLFLIFFIQTVIRERGSLLSYPPLIMVALSFSLYENPFFKMVCLPVVPLIFGFYLLDEGPKRWHLVAVIRRLLVAVLLPLTYLGRATIAHVDLGSRLPSLPIPLAGSIAKGLTILLFLSLLVIIPLLSWADHLFAERMVWIQVFLGDYLLALLPEGMIARGVVFILLDLLILATIFAWQKKREETEAPVLTMTDSISAGIVLAGVLLIYSVFLSVQAERLFVTQLPTHFSEIVWYVKSGFWQLIALSVVNILIFVGYYQRTALVVQRLLAGFTLASLLILLSAGHRMFLYVTSRGLSYEKFYASYAVLYCAVLFALLLWSLLGRKRIEALQVTINLFVWMFGIVSILPVEQIVLKTNISLYTAQRETSIELRDMAMLSSDVYGLVIENEELLKRRNFSWDSWLDFAADTLREKEWYEMNLSALVQRRHLR